MSGESVKVAAFTIEETTPLTRVYHTRIELLDEGFAVQSGWAGMKWINEATPVGAMLDLLLSTRGVAAAEVKRHQFTIVRSPVFEWWEIERNIAPLLFGIGPALTIELSESDFRSLTTFDRSWLRELPASEDKSDFQNNSDQNSFTFAS